MRSKIFLIFLIFLLGSFPFLFAQENSHPKKRYITTVYCYDGELEVVTPYKRVILTEGQMTQVLSGQAPSMPSSITEIISPAAPSSEELPPSQQGNISSPKISSVSPNSVAQDTTTSVTISGSDFQSGATVSFSGSGVTVNSTTVSSSSITANITVSSTAALGFRDITVTNPDGSSYTASDIFTVTGRDYAYVANRGSDNVSIIDTSTNTVTKNLTVGTAPWGVAITPNGNTAYVANSVTSGRISVIDTSTNTVTTTISTNIGANPQFLAITPNGNKAYVSNQGDIAPQGISVITTSNNTATFLDMGPGTDGPSGLAITPNGNTLYVANIDSNNVSVIATSTDTVSTNISVGTAPRGIAITPDGNSVYVTNSGSNTISVISTSTNTVSATISLTAGSTPYGIAITPDGKYAYIANYDANTVLVIKTSDNSTTTTISVGTNPYWVAITPNGEHAYVTNYGSNSVSVIDISNNTVIKTITTDIGTQPLGIAIRDPGSASSNKKANKRQVNRGDIVTYTITLKNEQTADVYSLTLTDKLPAGFKYIEGSSTLDNASITPTYSGNTLTYTIGTVEANEKKVLKYQVRVSSGVTFGTYINRATATGTLNNANFTLLDATASVKVVPDPIFDLGTLIGKVFVDKNQNGLQDENENGLEGITLVSEEGIKVTTDNQGRYHIPGLWPRDHIIKLDTQTLPKDYRLTSDNPVYINMTEGLLSKVDFKLTEEPGHQESQTQLPLLGEDYFLVFLGSLDLYKLSTEGKLATVDTNEKFENKWHLDDRVSFYLKGKIKGEYLLTASLDTQRDNQEIDRYIDPDKYYPVYGDNSQIDWEATNTQGLFFAKIEKDSSYLVWGNFETDFKDTSLATFDRSLYGAKLHYESTTVTSFNLPKQKLKVFSSLAKQAASYDRFLGTGGSLYYLKHKNIIPGSEKVYVEIKDRITNLSLAYIDVGSLDYDIDYDQGRVILKRPLSSIAQSQYLISDELLNGEPVYLRIEYEYETQDPLRRAVQGARLSRFLTDNFSLGGTYLNNNTDGKNYQLYGADTQYLWDEDNWLKFEFSRSFTSAIDYNYSSDGGINFTHYTQGSYKRGDAFSFLSQNTFFDERLSLKPYFKKIYPGFANTSVLHISGIELFGLEADYKLSEKTNLNALHNVQITLAGENVTSSTTPSARRIQTNEIGFSHQLTERLDLDTAYRLTQKRNVLNSQTDEKKTQTLASKLSYEFGKNLNTYLRLQSNLEGKTNDQGSVGVNYNLSPETSLSIEEAFGNKGNATLLGLSHRFDDTSSINTQVSIGSEGISSSLGASSQIDKNTDLGYTKSYATDYASDRISLTKHLKENLDIWLSFERSELDDQAETTHRDAFSLNLDYTNHKSLNLSNKFEWRKDKSSSTKAFYQFLTSNLLRYTFREDFFTYLKLNFSFDEDSRDSSVNETFREFSLGLAFRPSKWNKLNFLAKAAHLWDASPTSQDDYSDITKEVSNVFSLEYIYDIKTWLSWSQKFALKLKEERTGGLPLQHSQLQLGLNRINLKFTPTVGMGLEYRILIGEETKSHKDGVLLELDKYLGKNFVVAVGYDFTDFSDDLTYDDDYKAKGVFFKVKGMY